MKINNIQNYTNFKGITNVTANDVKGEIERFTFLSMQLNDKETNDLTRLKELVKLRPETSKKFEDVMTLSYSRIGNHNVLLLDGNLLPNGETLNGLRNAYYEGKLSEEFFNREEKFAIKAYTFLADITKRLMNQNKPLDCDTLGKVKVFQEGCENIKQHSIQEREAMIYMTDTMREHVPFQKVAGFFNRMIAKRMTKYFL